MISVVCSSRSNLDDFETIVRKTSGVPNLEFIGYQNNGEHSLTELYADALTKASNDVVVFLHDDIEFEANRWGRKLLKHFDSTDFGMLGVAGSTELPDNGKWWSNRGTMVGIVNHKQGDKKWESRFSGNFTDRVIETTSLDGVFFAVKRDRLTYEFDKNVEGFHFYDIDFTFGNHVNGTKVGVIFDVRLTHLSVGKTNDKWEENRVKFVDKWSNDLPKVLKPDIIVDDAKIKTKKKPKVTLLTPSKNNLTHLTNLLESIDKVSTYSNLEIVIGDTGSDPEILTDIRKLVSRFDNARLVEFDYYNFAKINNELVLNEVSDDTELLLFCNDDIILLNDAISITVSEYLKRGKKCGTLGCRLHFMDNTLQHGGMIPIKNRQNNSLVVTHKAFKSSYNYNNFTHEVMGNTGAFLLISKPLFIQVGGFNEGYVTCFEDVELNVRLLALGKANYFVGNAVCYHVESVTRSKSPDKMELEREDFQKRLYPMLQDNMTAIGKFITY